MRRLEFGVVLVVCAMAFANASLGASSNSSKTSLIPSANKYTYRAEGAIVGHCTVLAGFENSLPTACKNVALTLKGPKSEAIQRTSTDDQGNFKFAAKNGARYEIASGSEDYAIASPTEPVIGGDLLDIKLNAK